MGRSKETFGKKEVKNKQLKKRKDKEKRRLEKKELGKSNFNDMIAWVDENGQICSTPPDLSNREEVDADSIEISIPKSVARDENLKFEGKVKTFDESRGFGFINSNQLKASVFFHINDCAEEIKAGDRVEFDTEKGIKGLKAINIKRIVN
jgi:cold shock CspA family protein